MPADSTTIAPSSSAIQAGLTGVLIANLGTPDAPTPAAVRRYLKEFLWDPRVVEIPRIAWWLILNGIILNTRPAKSAVKYQSVWTPEGSPLKVHTVRQSALLAAALGPQQQSGLLVDWAMRYGTPSIAAGLDRLRAAGCTRLLVVPMYPQYADSTNASVGDSVLAWQKRNRDAPPLRMVGSFHDDPGYIAALAASVREHWAQHDRPDRLVMSFHGLPRYTLERGDPYHDQCHTTGGLLARALALQDGHWQVCFQSRFGPAKWLEPYTSVTLEALGREGVGRVDVVCPGFVADCLETLEEIAMEGSETFLHAGGKTYHALPCLNERSDWIEALAALVRREAALIP